MDLDPLFLSRLQWAWVIAWHILLPAFTVGLASYIAVLEGLYFFTRREIWFRISRFWTRIFSVSFAMGVVSGIVMPFQFGTNWSRFSDAAANVISPLLAYEDLMAFFLEATFLGVLLFGRKLVPAWAHFFAACMVALGTLFSSFWILAANSWMQTPAGYEVHDGRFFPTDWLAIVFNPSFPYRLAHNVSAFYVTTGFVVLGVGAWLVRRGGFAPESRLMVGMALGFLSLFVPLQIFLGDQHGLNTLEYQPAKLAAIEGRWETVSPTPLTLFGIPDQQAERNDYAIDIPYLGSLILTHSLTGEIKGLKDWPPDQRPPVWPVFFAFRIMVGIGFLMLGVVALGGVLWWRNRLFETTWFLRLCQWVAPLGFVAVIAGWTTTEVGRQPWTIYGLLRTSQSVSPSLTGPDVLLSLLAYMAVYLIMFPAGVAVMARIIREGPVAQTAPDEPVEGVQRKVPLPTHGGVAVMGGGLLDLVLIWTVIIALGVFLYVLLDGFDLGVGMLYGLAPEADKSTVMNAVAPVWDGNETWLILGGVALLAVFPLAFAIIIPAVYFPVLLMLLALIFRGVAFEFRFSQPWISRFWAQGFCFGSGLATFAQGAVLGAFIQGFAVDGRHFAGSSWDWLTPFSVLTGVALMLGYGLLGAGWLVIKTEGELQIWARRMGRICLIGVLAAILAVSLWTPLANPDIARRWFSWPNLLFLSPVPILTALIAWAAWRALQGWGGDVAPFLAAIGLFLMSYLGIAISLWPMIVPPHYTLWQAASSEATQAFLLIGTLVLLPVILMYTAWSYWVFRGKLRGDVGYH